MLVALDGHQNFSAIEALLDWRRAVRLRLVPLGIVLRRPVNIVLRVIAIGDVDLLIRLHTQDVRSVMATILIELDRGGRRGPGVIGQLLAAFESSRSEEHTSEFQSHSFISYA